MQAFEAGKGKPVRVHAYACVYVRVCIYVEHCVDELDPAFDFYLDTYVGGVKMVSDLC